MKPRSFQFEAHPEKGKVSGLLLKPRDSVALVVLGHGAGAGMTHANMAGIAEAFARQKIATMRYQFPFMERGGGRDSQEVSVATVRNAVARGAKYAGELPLFAGGHSYGGRMTSMAAAEGQLEQVTGLIFCSYPLHMPGKPSDKRALHLPDISVPVLFLSGTRDKMMTIDLLQPALKKMGKRATLNWLDTADHGYKTLKRTRTVEVDVFDEMSAYAREWIDNQS